MFTYSIKDHQIEVVGALGFQEDSPGWLIPRRLPDWTIKQFADDAIDRFVKFPSGIRLRFTTSADLITLKVRVSRLVITGLAEMFALQDLICWLMVLKTRVRKRTMEIFFA